MCPQRMARQQHCPPRPARCPPRSPVPGVGPAAAQPPSALGVHPEPPVPQRGPQPVLQGTLWGQGFQGGSAVPSCPPLPGWHSPVGWWWVMRPLSMLTRIRVGSSEACGYLHWHQTRPHAPAPVSPGMSPFHTTTLVPAVPILPTPSLPHPTLTCSVTCVPLPYCCPHVLHPQPPSSSTTCPQALDLVSSSSTNPMSPFLSF